MTDASGYMPVVAVKRDSSGFLDTGERFCVCTVPSGAIVSSGDVVFYGYPEADKRCKGVCISDVLFVSKETYEMICRITHSDPANALQLLARVEVNWFSDRKEDAVEQTLL